MDRPQCQRREVAPLPVEDCSTERGSENGSAPTVEQCPPRENRIQLPAHPPSLHVYMELSLNGAKSKKIQIRLFPDSFPQGVENFYRIVTGDSWRTVELGRCGSRGGLTKCIQRSYSKTKFYRNIWNGYLLGGDIYHNRGTSGGTVFDDQGIPPPDRDWHFKHDRPYLISLVPYYDQETGDRFYDSTFMITLVGGTECNLVGCLDSDQIVIGYVYRGEAVLKEINEALRPSPNLRKPLIKITASGCS